MTLFNTPIDIAITRAETIINRHLKRSTVNTEALQRLNHKQLLIRCTRPELAVLIHIDQQQLHLQRINAESSSSNIDTTLEASASELLGFLTQTDDSSVITRNPNITLRGDAHAMQLLSSVLRTLDIDFELGLSRFLGDVPAHAIGQLYRHLLNTGIQYSHRFQQHLEEYALHELKLMPNRCEFSTFTQDVHDLKQHTERLQAKMKQLNYSQHKHDS